MLQAVCPLNILACQEYDEAYPYGGYPYGYVPSIEQHYNYAGGYYPTVGEWAAKQGQRGPLPPCVLKTTLAINP